MGNGDVFDGDASVFVEVPKMMTSKYSSEVGDNAVWETKSVNDIFEELDYFLCSSGDERFILNPLGELINGDIYVLEATWRWLKRANQSSPQHAKGQEARMVCSSCAGTCICLVKNWHPSQRRMRSSTSKIAVGQ